MIQNDHYGQNIYSTRDGNVNSISFHSGFEIHFPMLKTTEYMKKLSIAYKPCQMKLPTRIRTVVVLYIIIPIKCLPSSSFDIWLRIALIKGYKFWSTPPQIANHKHKFHRQANTRAIIDRMSATASRNSKKAFLIIWNGASIVAQCALV